MMRTSVALYEEVTIHRLPDHGDLEAARDRHVPAMIYQWRSKPGGMDALDGKP